MLRRLPLALLLAILALSPAHAAEPYLGRRTEDPAWCANTTRSSDEMPITITPRAIETFAASRRILAVKQA